MAGNRTFFNKINQPPSFTGLDEAISRLPMSGATNIPNPNASWADQLKMRALQTQSNPHATSNVVNPSWINPGPARPPAGGRRGIPQVIIPRTTMKQRIAANSHFYKNKGKYAAFAAGFGLVAGAVGARDTARSAYIEQGDQRVQSRYLQNIVNKHRVGPRGMGQSSYLSPLATSASGMTLALHYQNQSGLGRKGTLGMSTNRMNYRDIIRTRTGL